MRKLIGLTMLLVLSVAMLTACKGKEEKTTEEPKKAEVEIPKELPQDLKVHITPKYERKDIERKIREEADVKRYDSQMTEMKAGTGIALNYREYTYDRKEFYYLEAVLSEAARPAVPDAEIYYMGDEIVYEEYRTSLGKMYGKEGDYGFMLSVSEKDANGNEVYLQETYCITVTEYDSRGIVTECCRYNDDGDLTDGYVRTLDEEGNLKREVTFYVTGVSAKSEFGHPNYIYPEGTPMKIEIVENMSY